MNSFCNQCGSKLPIEARFCSNCGAAQQPAQWVPEKPLMRPVGGRVIAGVCLALTRTYGWDITAVRIITILSFCISGGVVGIAYLACWVGIPEEPVAYPPVL